MERQIKYVPWNPEVWEIRGRTCHDIWMMGQKGIFKVSHWVSINELNAGTGTPIKKIVIQVFLGWPSNTGSNAFEFNYSNGDGTFDSNFKLVFAQELVIGNNDK